MLNFLNSGRAAGRWRRAAILAAFTLFSPQVFAFTFTVDSTADEVDANPGDGLCRSANGNCTLRAAVQEANAWSGPDVIRLPAGTYNLTIPNSPGLPDENAGATGDADILDDLTINGEGAATTIIDGNSQDRIFDVVGKVSFTLSNVTVTHGDVGNSEIGAGIKSVGNLTLNNDIITSNTNSASGGGGVANEQGNLSVNYSEIRGNAASSFGGIQHNFGLLTIDHSLISGNTAGSGAGVGVFNGTASITNSTIEGNTGAAIQGGQGGGIYNAGTLNVTNTTVDGNTGAQGGGIANAGTGTIVVVNSTIDNNTSQSGGGILNQSPGQGVGGSSASGIIINSVINGNKAQGTLGQTAGYGGGIFYSKSTTSLVNTIVSNNTANTHGAGCDDGTAFSQWPAGTLLDHGHNIESGNTCLLSATGDKIDTSPSLGTLASNGGPTQTLAPNSGSSAIDGGSTTCQDQSGNDLTTDQRGFQRPVGSACDVGPVEVQSATGADLTVHTTQALNPVKAGTDSETYMVNVINNGPGDATSVTLTDTLPASTSFTSAGATTCSPSGNTVTCTIASIPAGTGVPIDITAAVSPGATGTLTNTATVSGTGDPNQANNSDSIKTTVDLHADMTVTMTHNPEPAVLNHDKVTYSITVQSNNSGGADTIPSVVLTDSLPSSATLVTHSTVTDKGTCTENASAKLITCRFPNMAPGAAAHITLTVTPNVKGTMTNTAIVNYDGTDDNPVDNKAVDQASVEVHADVGVTVTDVPDPVLLKNDLTYIINVINNGPSPSSDVVLTATLPAAATFGSAGASRGLPCVQSALQVVCDLQSMASGAQATATIFVSPQVKGSLNFTASVAVPADEKDLNPANDNASAFTTVNDNPGGATADLAMHLVSVPTQVGVNGSLSYTMTVDNGGPDPAQGVIATLSLPVSVTLPHTLPTGCAGDPLVGSVVHCTIGGIDFGKSGTATVTVTPTKAGVINATASATFVGTDPLTVNNVATVATTVGSASTGGGSGSGGGGGGGGSAPLALLGLASLYAVAYRRRHRRR